MVRLESERISLHRCTQFFALRHNFLLAQALLLGPSWHPGGDAFLCLVLTPFQGRLQSFHGLLAVLQLRAALGGLGHDAGWQVADAHGRIGGVAVLTARSGGPVELDPYVCFFYLYAHSSQ